MNVDNARHRSLNSHPNVNHRMCSIKYKSSSLVRSVACFAVQILSFDSIDLTDVSLVPSVGSQFASRHVSLRNWLNIQAPIIWQLCFMQVCMNSCYSAVYDSLKEDYIEQLCCSVQYSLNPDILFHIYIYIFLLRSIIIEHVKFKYHTVSLRQ